MQKYIYTILLLCISNTLSAQTPSWAFNLGAGTDVNGKCCKVAPNGNVCIAGKFAGTMDLDPGPGVYNITSHGLDDIFLACYTSTGTFLWGFGIGGPSYDAARTMTIDAFNNIIICGYVQSAGIDFDPGAGVTTLTYAGGTGLAYYGDGFVAKFSPTGVFQWAKDLGGSTVYDHIESVGTDLRGNVYVGGEFDNYMTVAGGPTWYSGTDGQAYIIKYNSSGTFIWGHNFGLPGTAATDCNPYGLVVSNGYIYVGGLFQATCNFNPWGTPAFLTTVGYYDSFIGKYDTDGNYVYAFPVSGNGYLDQLLGLALDPSDNIYVTGMTNSNTMTFNPASPGTSTVNCPGGGGSNYDIFIAKYTSTGAYQWGTVLGGSGDDYGWSVDVSNNYVYFTGLFHGTVDMDPSAATANLVSNGASDVFVTKYDLNGNYVCGFNIGSPVTDDEGFSLTHDATGSIYVSGQFGGNNVDFDPSAAAYPLSAITTNDAFLVKYNYVGPSTISGSLIGDTLCVAGSAAHLTLVTAAGPGPYTITYSDGTNSYTLSGIMSGVPFTLTPAPTVTTTYTLTSITAGSSVNCTSSSGSGFAPAVVLISPCYRCDSLALRDSVHVCISDTLTMPAILTGSNTILSIQWTPATGLSSTTILNPLLTATTSGWYDLTVQSLIPNNLVVNGDFSAGNTGFTSSYIYSAPPSSVLNEGYYSVYNNPYGVHTGFTSFGDHTTGTGNMMIINGGLSPTSLWCQTIPVVPNTDYDFSAWFANCSSVTTGPNVPILQFMVNGVLLGTPTTVSAAPGTWVNFFATWNSGANTSATICIYDEVTTASGNDFVIDDISFEQICKAKDSIYVKVNTPDTTYHHSNDSICTTVASITLNAPTGHTAYLWSTGDTTSSISVNTVGVYWVYAPGNCAMLIDTIHVKSITPDTTYHHNSSSSCTSAGLVTLNAPVGYHPYIWSTGDTTSTINVGIAGNYWVYASGSCTMLIDTFNVVIKPTPPPPNVRDTFYCRGFGAPLPLTAQVDSVPGTLNWYLGGILLSGVPAFSTTNPAVTTWYVGQTVDDCKSDSVALTVTIIAPPSSVISSGPWVCRYDSIPMTYTLENGTALPGNYLWSLPTGATNVNGTSLTDSSVMVQFDSVNNNNHVYLTITYLNGECSVNDTTSIDVIGLPAATAYSRPDVCIDDTVGLALSFKSANAISFAWQIDQTPLFSSSVINIIAANSNSGGPYSISWLDTGKHIIYVQAFAEHGCAGVPTADTVNVHQLPDASFSITTGNGTLCLEDSVLFTANNNDYANNYKWAPAHFFNNVYKPTMWGKVELEHSIITLTVTDPFGCNASYSQELDPNSCCTVAFPNAFTPNGDHHNDVYRPIYTGYHRFHTFLIQNRWGQTVFESTDNTAAWDGNFNGVPQDIGVYFYYIKYDCGGKTIEQKGDLTLIR